jgi:tetratricopeptide (TPR) repeat protein
MAASISEFWTVHGHIREAETWLDELLSRYNARNSEMRWTVQTALGTIKQFRGQIARSSDLYLDALETARALNDKHRIARSLRGIAANKYIEFDFESALQHTEEAKKISSSVGDEFGTAAALARLGDIAMAKGDNDEAARLTSESLELFRKVGYIQGITAKLSNLAAAEIMRGNLQSAELSLRESLELCLDIGDTTITQLVLDGFAALRTVQGQYVDAARISGATRNMIKSLGVLVQPADERLRDFYLKELDKALDENELVQARNEGERMSLDDIAALALGKQNK